MHSTGLLHFLDYVHTGTKSFLIDLLLKDAMEYKRWIHILSSDFVSEASVIIRLD